MGAQVSSHDELVQELVRSTSERDVAAMRELTAAIADLVDYEQSGPEDSRLNMELIVRSHGGKINSSTGMFEGIKCKKPRFCELCRPRPVFTESGRQPAHPPMKTGLTALADLMLEETLPIVQKNVIHALDLITEIGPEYHQSAFKCGVLHNCLHMASMTEKYQELGMDIIANFAQSDYGVEKIMEKSGLDSIALLLFSMSSDVGWQACRALQNITRHENVAATFLEKKDGASTIVLLCKNPHPLIQQYALGTAANIAKLPSKRAHLATAAHLQWYTTHLGSPHEAVSSEAARTLAGLALTDSLSDKIGKAGALAPLCELANDVLARPLSGTQASVCLLNLSARDENQVKVSALGGLDALKRLADSEDIDMKVLATNGFCTAAKNAVHSGNFDAVRLVENNYLRAMIDLTTAPSCSAQTVALEGLASLCFSEYSNQVVATACGEGVLLKALVDIVLDNDQAHISLSESNLETYAAHDAHRQRLRLDPMLHPEQMERRVQATRLLGTLCAGNQNLRAQVLMMTKGGSPSVQGQLIKKLIFSQNVDYELDSDSFVWESELELEFVLLLGCMAHKEEQITKKKLWKTPDLVMIQVAALIGKDGVPLDRQWKAAATMINFVGVSNERSVMGIVWLRVGVNQGKFSEFCKTTNYITLKWCGLLITALCQSEDREVKFPDQDEPTGIPRAKDEKYRMQQAAMGDGVAIKAMHDSIDLLNPDISKVPECQRACLQALYELAEEPYNTVELIKANLANKLIEYVCYLEGQMKLGDYGFEGAYEELAIMGSRDLMVISAVCPRWKYKAYFPELFEGLIAEVK